MSTPTSTTTNAASPADELAALIAQVETLSQLAVHVQGRQCPLLSSPLLTLPSANMTRVLVGQLVNTIVHPSRAINYIQGVPLTPDEVEVAHALSVELQPYYVVIVGREPGIYASSQAANAQTDGVPRQRQQKQATRTLALGAYRTLFPEVEKWNVA
ncbi:hypothetical protein C8J57DRAFT_1218550 [Mycena rebaudengoi]|nr:hypothetical protein C8J57DRAFT_1218550 [Mycena rebaudengoi]